MPLRIRSYLLESETAINLHESLSRAEAVSCCEGWETVIFLEHGGSKELEYLSSALSILHRLLPTLLPKAEWEDIGYRLDKDTDFEGRIIKSQVLSTSLSPTEAHETSQGEGSWYIYWTVSGCWPHLRMAGLEFCSRLLSVPLCPHAGLVLQGKHSPRCWSHRPRTVNLLQDIWLFSLQYVYFLALLCAWTLMWNGKMPTMW